MLTARVATQTEKNALAYDPKQDYRYLHVQVLDPKGKPAQDRFAHLLPISTEVSSPYDALRFSDPENNFTPVPWACQTDTSGRFTAFLRTTWDEKRGVPGPGHFVYLVNSSPDDAGGLSTSFTNPRDLPVPQRNLAHRDLSRALRSDGLKLTIQIVPGFTIQGTIVDLDDPQNPVSDGIVRAYVDGPISGQGGSAFRREAHCDARGNFTLAHCFPKTNQIKLDFDGPHAPGWRWVKTEIGGKPSDADTKGVTPDSPTGEVQLTIYVQRIQH